MQANSIHFTNKVRVFAIALLALLLCFVTYNSNGVIRGGDEDNGSGLGGTGRTLLNSEPSGSGLGGTGFRPYLGYSQPDNSPSTELEIVSSARQNSKPVAQGVVDSVFENSTPLLEKPIEHDIVVVNPDEKTEDSGALSIEESMQWEIDAQIVTLEASRQLLAFNPIEESLLNTSRPKNRTGDIPTRQSEEVENSDTSDQSTSHSSESTLSWATLVQQLNSESTADADEVASTATSEDDGIAERPERFQRPALPPVQRIQPVRRAGLLPPRIRPLRL